LQFTPDVASDFSSLITSNKVHLTLVILVLGFVIGMKNSFGEGNLCGLFV